VASASIESRRVRGPDTVIVAVVAILVALGLVMVFSASSVAAYRAHGDGAFYLKRQAIWLGVALCAAFVAYRCDYHLLRRLAPYALAASVVSLLLVFVPHLGLSSGGGRRWLGTSAISFQPSEFAKLSLVFYLAAALSRKEDKIRSLVHGLVPLCGVCAALAVLVIKEPDLGTASLLVFTAAVMLYAGGARLSHLIAVALVTFPAVVIVVMSSPYRRARVLAFMDPWKDPLNSGFHIRQSLLALGSGGHVGVGLGLSRQKFDYLPEPFTDFIMSILGEELGIIGTTLVVALFVVFAYRAIRIALRAPDEFGFFLAIGCAATIVVQAFVNIGVVTGSWPVTGVPLPFISFGGSSLVVSLIAVALVLNVGRARTRAGSEA